MSNKGRIVFVLRRALAALGGRFVPKGTVVRETASDDQTRTFQTDGHTIVVERGSAAEGSIQEKRD